MDAETKEFLNQTRHPPIEELYLIETHIRLVSTHLSWSDVGILFDEGPRAVVILLINDCQIVSALRFCLSVEESVEAIEMFSKEDGKFLLGGYQGAELSSINLYTLSNIEAIWQSITDQISEIDIEDVRSFFQRIEEDSLRAGRGASLSSTTKNRVILDGHARCMFEGCGRRLDVDELTGTEGNYFYLAHNVASSEKGARGMIELSGKLSDQPENILLMCDKHHRLVDKVAAADYSAQRLSVMRREFLERSNELLNGLSYEPVAVFSVLWPVHRQVIAPPSQLQIAQSLATMQCRMSAQMNVVSDNESVLREMDPEVVETVMRHSITITADRLLAQAHAVNFRAGLFAFGLMPHLIALGALLGNKGNFTPMLRYRDSGRWLWPDDAPYGHFFEIGGLQGLGSKEGEIILTLALTAEPKSLISTRDSVGSKLGLSHVVVKALPDRMGNGSLGHPSDGYLFTSEIQKLLHLLKDNHGVERVHVLPCASNAACVFFGQAFDSHHPELLVYDFNTSYMSPSVLIRNRENKCEISAP